MKTKNSAFPKPPLSIKTAGLFLTIIVFLFASVFLLNSNSGSGTLDTTVFSSGDNVFVKVAPVQVDTTFNDVKLEMSLGLPAKNKFCFADSRNTKCRQVSYAVLMNESTTQQVRFDQFRRSSVFGSLYKSQGIMKKNMANGLWKVGKVVLIDETGKENVFDYQYLIENKKARKADLEVRNMSSKADMAPPMVFGLSLAPILVDASVSDQVLNLDIKLSDGLSGVCLSGDPECINNPTRLRLQSESGLEKLDFVDLKRINGTSRVGLGDYQALAVMKKGSEKGAWKVAELTLVDKVGNQRVLNYEDLQSWDFQQKVLKIENEILADTVKPELEWLAFAPDVVDISNGAQRVELTLRVNDQSALKYNGDETGTLILLENINTKEVLDFSYFRKSEKVFSLANTTEYISGASMLENATPGIWRIKQVTLADVAGNLNTYSYEQLQNLNEVGSVDNDLEFEVIKN
jgi:hypothetical protein